MSYTSHDLALFIPLRDPAKCVGTAYFEFHPAELPREFACWLEGSLFLQDVAFDFHSECFHRADPNFDYFSFQRYDLDGIEKISFELEQFLKSLTRKSSRDAIFASYNSLFGKEIWSQVPTPDLARAVHNSGHDLLTFIRQSTKASGCLWVLGM